MVMAENFLLLYNCITLMRLSLTIFIEHVRVIDNELDGMIEWRVCCVVCYTVILTEMHGMES